MRALLVDDDPSIRAVITRILSRQFEQIQIVECQNGVEALEELSRDAYSLVLLDLAMPLMDGFDVLESLRRSPATSAIPVIMMTGVNDEATVRRILGVGVTDYILKPVRPGQLCERVSRIVGKLAPEDMDEAHHAAFAPLELTSKTHVLIADGDHDFRQFFRKAMMQRCTVDTSGSGLDAFQSCLHQPPDVMFIGAGLGLVSGEILVRKLRDHARLSQIRVIGIEPQNTLVQARKRGIYEAVILRTFVSDVFDEAVNSLLQRPGAPSDILTLVPDLKLAAISASEEALSATLERSVSLKPVVAPPAQWAAAAVTLQIGRDGTAIQIRLSTASKNLPRLGQRLVEKNLVSIGEASELALPTLVTALSRTLATEFRCRNLAVVSSDPVSSKATAKKNTPAPVGSSDDIAIEFEVTGERLALRLDVCVAPLLLTKQAGAA
jgi:DNA-binding response OmpR family regulator